MKKNNALAELIVASSESDANLYYATHFLVPDPVYFFKIHGKKYLILNDLEVDRGRKEADVNEVISLSEVQEKFLKKMKRKGSGVDWLAYLLKEHGVRSGIVPYTFPGYIASELEKRKIKIHYRPDPFWKNRILKTQKEKEAIKTSLKHTGNAIRKAYEVLRASTVKKNTLYYHGQVLSSERLRHVIDSYLLEQACLAQNTIVAGGNQAVDPHNRGSGPLYAHQAIVMDVFPRSMKTQYYADMTRTTVKGKPSAELKKMWLAVKEAQERAIEKIKQGVNGKTVHQWILDFFESKGFKSGKIKGRMQGFFHGTGHGLGLDIHEAPRVSAVPEILKEGMVVTVEPGLYYQGIGGVRIEDVVYVTKKGCEVLSLCPKILHIS